MLPYMTETTSLNPMNIDEIFLGENFPDFIETAVVPGIKQKFTGTAMSTGEMAEIATAAIYQAISAGSAPLAWIYLRVDIGAQPAHQVLSQSIKPLIAELKEKGLVKGWWFLVKTDMLGCAVRLRIQVGTAEQPDADEVINRWRAARQLKVSRLKYEPEFCLFGGKGGIDIAHEIFHLDSEFITGLAPRENPGDKLVSTGLSIICALHLLRSVRLDVFECWDVFAQILGKRPTSEADRARYAPVCDQMKAVIGRHYRFDLSLVDEPLRRTLEAYFDGLSATGAQLERLNYAGELHCGLREYTAAILIFCWNRAGLSFVAQRTLAQSFSDFFQEISQAK
jgi:thiopeptide-type bacteriocin biosynthesis protein